MALANSLRNERDKLHTRQCYCYVDADTPPSPVHSGPAWSATHLKLAGPRGLDVQEHLLPFGELLGEHVGLEKKFHGGHVPFDNNGQKQALKATPHRAHNGAR